MLPSRVIILAVLFLMGTTAWGQSGGLSEDVWYYESATNRVYKLPEGYVACPDPQGDRGVTATAGTTTFTLSTIRDELRKLTVALGAACGDGSLKLRVQLVILSRFSEVVAGSGLSPGQTPYFVSPQEGDTKRFQLVFYNAIFRAQEQVNQWTLLPRNFEMTDGKWEPQGDGFVAFSFRLKSDVPLPKVLVVKLAAARDPTAVVFKGDDGSHLVMNIDFDKWNLSQNNLERAVEANGDNFKPGTKLKLTLPSYLLHAVQPASEMKCGESQQACGKPTLVGSNTTEILLPKDKDKNKELADPSVAAILKNNLDTEPTAEQSPLTALPPHGNVRGSDYYH